MVVGLAVPDHMDIFRLLAPTYPVGDALTHQPLYPAGKPQDPAACTGERYASGAVHEHGVMMLIPRSRSDVSHRQPRCYLIEFSRELKGKVAGSGRLVV